MNLDSLFKLDSWTNLISGIGTTLDKTSGNMMMPDMFRTDAELESHWNYNGLSAKLVSAKADDMTREWITIPGDTDGLILDDLASLDAQSHVNMALKWCRLFGGSLMVLGIKDGEAELDKPLRANGGEVMWIKVYDRTRVIWNQADIVMDPQSPRFEDFEVYTVQRIDGTQMRVHWTRCIPFFGIPVPKSQWTTTDMIRRYWGMSILQPIYDELAAVGVTFKGIEGLMEEYSISTFTFENMRDIVSDTQNGVSKLLKRASAMASTKSMVRAVFLGVGESWKRDTVALTGVPDVMDRFVRKLCAVSGYPPTRLGMSITGLNASGDSEERQYYDDTHSEQEVKLRPALARLITLVAKGKKRSWEKRGQGAFADLVPFKYKPLRTPTLKEQLEAKNIQADIDKKYVDMQVYSADEVRESRFKNEYSFDTKVEGDLEPVTPKIPMVPAPGTPGATTVLPPARPGRKPPVPNNGKPTP